MRSGRRSAVPVVVAVALIGALLPALATPRPAAAHAFLERSEPTANSVLEAPPSAVGLWFTEPLETSNSRAVLYDQNGEVVDGATSRPGGDRNEMVLAVPDGLPNGTYSVLWQTLSAADGHTAQGYFAFTVGTDADVRTVIPPALTTTGGPPDWLRALSRWAALLGLAAAVAIWPVWLFVLHSAGGVAGADGPALIRRLRRLGMWAVGFFLLGNVFALLVQAAADTSTGGFGSRLATTLNDTRYGFLWLVRIGLVLVYAAALLACDWRWPWRRRSLALLTLGLAAALPVPFSLIAHAAGQRSGRTVAIAFDVFHLLGVSLWVGGLFVLAAVLVPTVRTLAPPVRRAVLVRVLPRFSALALAAWAVLAVTGLYSAWLQVGNWTGLRDTAYGRSLTVKLVLLVPLLLLGAFNLLAVTRNLQRPNADERTVDGWSRRFGLAIGAEVALVVLVLFVVGRLIGQAPAREVLAQRIGHTSLALELGGRDATLAVAPGATGPNHFRLEVGGGPLPANSTAVLRLELPSVDTGRKELKLVRAAGNAFEGHGSELSIAGDWTIEAILRQPGENDLAATRTFALGTEPPIVRLPSPAWHFDRSALPGLLFLVLGIAGLVLARMSANTRRRRQSGGLGLAALSLGAGLLLLWRTTPAGVTPVAAATNPVQPSVASITRGEEVYAANCLQCHGATGNGDGPAAAGLDSPVADLASAHARSHLDQDLFYWIENGIDGSAMPAFGDRLDDAEIWDTINYVRYRLRGNVVPRGTPEPIGERTTPDGG